MLPLAPTRRRLRTVLSVAAVLALVATSASAQQDDATPQPGATTEQAPTTAPSPAPDPDPTAEPTSDPDPGPTTEATPATGAAPTVEPDTTTATATDAAPTTDPDAGGTDDRRTALEDAVAVEVGDNELLLTADGTACPTDEVEITFERIPAEQIVVGGYIDALEAPDPDTGTEATGIVTCGGDTSIVTGFDAMWEDGAWTLFVMPVDQHTLDHAFAEAAEEAHGDHDDHATGESLDGTTSDVDGTTSADSTTTSRSSLSSSGSAPVPAYPSNIAVTPDPLASYDGQDQCFSTVQPGTRALGDLIANTYPSNQSWYSLRGCSVGGKSEHKEGRALDWFVDAYDPQERALADRFTRWLTETDPYGNLYGGIRRMGLMYVIWNQQSWSSYRADDGWRAYTGASPHTDHVHISLSWAGADCETTWWVATGCSGVTATAAAQPMAFDLAVPADVDGDGTDEQLLYHRSTGKAEVWRTSSTGAFTTRLTGMSLASGWSSIAAGDVNGDGRDEYAFHRTDNGAYVVYSSRSDGSLGGKRGGQYFSGGWTKLAFGELWPGNGEELVLLRESNRSVRVMTTNNAGAPGTTLATATSDIAAKAIATTDTDGNGWDSLALHDSATGATRIVDVTSNGTLSTPRWAASLAAGWTQFHGADLDGDGDDEWLFVRNSDNRILVYEGGVQPSPGSTLSSATPGSGMKVLQADVNGDGQPELVHYDPGTGDMVIRRTTSTGAIGSVLDSYRLGAGWDNVLAEDFNGNGSDDLLFHRSSTGGTSIYSTTNTGRLASRLTTYNVASGWDNVETGHFRGHDGPALLFHRSSTGTVVTYAASSSGRLSSKLTGYRVSSGWDQVKPGDVDGDGIDEIRFRRDADGLLVTYGTTTGGRLRWSIDGARTTRTPMLLETADFDRDGDDELITYFPSSGSQRVHDGYPFLSLGDVLGSSYLG